jgi:hypothetical protein
MSEFQEFIHYFKETLMNKVNMLIESEFNKFEETFVKFNIDNGSSEDDVKQNLSSTSESENNSDSSRESSPERD